MHHVLISFQGIQGYLVSAIRPFTPVSVVHIGNPKLLLTLIYY